jgi:hypothetical protein
MIGLILGLFIGIPFGISIGVVAHQRHLLRIPLPESQVRLRILAGAARALGPLADHPPPGYEKELEALMDAVAAWEDSEHDEWNKRAEV